MDIMAGFWWELKERQMCKKKMENPQDSMDDWDGVEMKKKNRGNEEMLTRC